MPASVNQAMLVAIKRDERSEDLKQRSSTCGIVLSEEVFSFLFPPGDTALEGVGSRVGLTASRLFQGVATRAKFQRGVVRLRAYVRHPKSRLFRISLAHFLLCHFFFGLGTAVFCFASHAVLA